MIDDDLDRGWKQHFPTYHFDNRDIAIEEYKVAAKNLESEERVFLNASNITLVASAALGSLVVGVSEKLTDTFIDVVPGWVISLLLLFLVTSFSCINLKYFADRQRAIVFAGRKLIVLRRMLGLSYGKVQLLLPNWRTEGADEPLALKLFPGWSAYIAYPFWVIAIVSTSVIFFLCAYFLKLYPEIILVNFHNKFLIGIPITWLILVIFIYRKALLDTHETMRLLFYSWLAKLINMRLTNNVEYIIYRGKLAVYETERLKVDTKELTKFLVFIEDRHYYEHSGISYKSLLRSFLGLLGLKPRSGGSTIIQQLVRTLFIKDHNKIVRRKIFEFGLTPWLNEVLTKQMILQIYLSSVRFETGKYGVIQAMQYFWKTTKTNPSPAEAFFLIERVSNIRSKLLVNKIIDTVNAAVRNGLLTTADKAELLNLYQKSVRENKISATDDEIKKLSLNI